MTEMGPLLSGETLPLDFGHASAAQDQSAKLVHQSVVIAGIVIAKILLQSFEEVAFAILLTFETESYERSDGPAHTKV